MKKQKYWLPIAALILAQIFWGVNTPVIKLGLETVPLPLYLSITLIGGSILTTLLTYKKWKPVSPRDLAIITVGSLVGIALGNVALLMGLKLIPATNASLIGLFSPFLLFILSARFLRESMSLKTFVGILIAFLGALIIIGKPWQSSVAGQTVVIGSLLVLLDALCGVTETLMLKPVLKRVEPNQLTSINLFVGTLPVAIYSLQYLDHLSPTQAGRNGYMAMGFNIVAVAAANCLFFYGLKHKKAQDVGIFDYVHPIATGTAAWFILGEVPNKNIIIGAGLIFWGIYWAEVSKSTGLKLRHK